MNLLLFFSVQNRTWVCTPLVGTSQVIQVVNFALNDCMTQLRTVTGVDTHNTHHTIRYLSSLLPPLHLEEKKNHQNQSRVNHKEFIVLALGHKLMEKKLNLVNYAMNHFFVNSLMDSCSQNLSVLLASFHCLSRSSLLRPRGWFYNWGWGV